MIICGKPIAGVQTDDILSIQDGEPPKRENSVSDENSPCFGTVLNTVSMYVSLHKSSSRLLDSE